MQGINGVVNVDHDPLRHLPEGAAQRSTIAPPYLATNPVSRAGSPAGTSSIVRRDPDRGQPVLDHLEDGSERSRLASLPSS